MNRNTWHWTTLILLLLAATWLRVHRLVELPPGLHYDEAANGILASEIAFAGFRPIFITSYTGKEVLYFYLAGGLMRLLGDSIFALRLASTFIGLVTIATTYWLTIEVARALRLTKTAYLQLAGLLSAILLTTHFPHLIFSRLGFRAIAQPLLQALTIATFFYAVRTSSGQKLNWRAFALSGVWLGLAAYTYLAVRLFPFVVLIVALPLIRKAWRGLLTMLGTASVVLLPFALFFVRNPDTFWVRISQVSETQPTLSDYANSLIQSFGILLSVDGDPYWRFNNPDQPFFTLLMALAFVGGLLWLVWRMLSTQHAISRSAGLLLWVAPIVMILPTALAINEIVPSNLRAIGLYPFVLLPVALGLATLIIRLSAQTPLLHAVAPIILLLALGLFGYNDYFGRWAERADTFYDSDSDLIGAANFIDSSTLPTYVAALHYRHPTVAFASERYDELKWLVNSEALVLPPDAAQVVYPHNSPAPSWATELLGEPIALERGIDGADLYTVFQLPAKRPAPSIAAEINFSNVIKLIGYDIAEENTSSPAVRLYWEILATPDRPFAPFVHLIDETDFRWAQRETNAYPAEQWAIGETVIQDVTFDLPSGMPFAEYTAVVGLFDGHDRLPVVDADGRFAGMTFQIESLLLAGNPTPPLQTTAQIVSHGGSLVGYQLDADSAETGTRLPLTLHWQITQSQPYSLQLVDSANVATTLTESIVQVGTSSQRYAIERVSPLLPVDLASGVYRLAIEVEGQTVDLGAVEVVATERLFERPQVTFSAEIPFGNDIQLVGYELTNDQQLTLLWQANGTPANDYTVFVHVLHPDGTCCVWQQDTQPQQDGYPTARWVKDEYIIDQYQLAIEDSDLTTLPIEIGLYIAETGQRLPVGSQDYWILNWAK